jgi:dTDP-4-amino-4,6-dideoxygalactose transaminase
MDVKFAFRTESKMNPKVPLLDLRAQLEMIREPVYEAIRRVVESQQFVLGPEVEALEQDVAAYCGTRFAVGCSSGTDALLLALMALKVGPGDEVVTTPYTFFATAGVVVRLGARPVFVDIDPATFNIDCSALEQRITGKTKAIIPVHLYGQTADMETINAIAARRGIAVIEDACQAIGAEFRGRRAGAMGTAAAFSFFPTKNLGGFGDGGMLTTNDPTIAERTRILRVHGMEPKYYHSFVGIMGRLDALQAAVLRVKLQHLESWNACRQANARNYTNLFHSRGLSNWVTVPVEPAKGRHVFNQYVIRVPAAHRDPLRKHLSQSAIGTEIYYPVPLHLQECFATLGYRLGDFPHSERAATESITLPVYPEMTPDQQLHVVNSIADYVAATGKIRAHNAA